MGGHVRERRTTGAVRPAGSDALAGLVEPVRPVRFAIPAGPAARLLLLQRQVGNQAVVRLFDRSPRGGPRGTTGSGASGSIPDAARTRAADSGSARSGAAGSGAARAVVQRAGSSPEFTPVATLTPPGSLSESQWTAAVAAARAKPSAAAYEPLIRDIAVTAGMAALGSGFVPTPVPVTDGKTARPGLNMSMDPGDKPGHAGWVDGSGAYGIPFRLDKTTPPDRQVAVILSVGILKPDKGLSLSTVRHEMVHAKHKQKVLEAVKLWQALPVRGRPSLSEWLTKQTRKRRAPMSALDAVLIGKGVQDLGVNTEVLAYVESFVNSYHRRGPTAADAGPAFFDLLGAVQTDRFDTWKQADPTVQAEALTRLREYHATLDLPHQRLWRQWLDRQLERVGKDRYRKDFLTRLGAFVT